MKILYTCLMMTRPNLKKLIEILSDGFFHTGTELGEALGLTRGGVWKLIQQLQELGVEIESRTNKGYQIIDGLELLSVDEIKHYISAPERSAIADIVLLDQVPSTNDYLLQHPRVEPGKAVICLAESQTAGRGRFGRKWQAPYGSNLYLSLLWCFPMDSSQLSGLSLAVAVGIANALKLYGIAEHIGLKWPNDVLWMKKKLSGCLIETQGEAYGSCHTVIGVGMNLNMPAAYGEHIQGDWIDVRRIINNLPERNRLVGLIIQETIKILSVFQNQGLAPVKKSWEALDVSLNKSISLVAPAGIIHGIDRGIDHQGCLLLEDNQSQSIKAFHSGEVSLRFAWKEF